MPRIRFTHEPKLPRDLAHLGYCKDMEVDLSDDHADRWLRRGVAVIVPDAKPAVVAPEPEPPVVVPEPAEVEIPEDWEEHHHMARMALARRLTDEPVENAAAADQVIAAEVARREAGDGQDEVAHHPV